MIEDIEKALADALRNWNTMAGAGHDEAEAAANEFEASFYHFIDALREWVNGLERRPQTMEEFMELPEIQDILVLLPAPLLLNFETEAELILEQQIRIDEDKYD
jgi:hypothetical protein